jgi:predicted ribosome quality control (RQC) complex YloA/Tae2 family protein
MKFQTKSKGTSTRKPKENYYNTKATKYTDKLKSLHTLLEGLQNDARTEKQFGSFL